MGYNIGSYRNRCYSDCPNRNPRFDTRGPYDRRLSPGRDRFDRYDRYDGRRRFDYDDYRERRGGCCSGRRRRYSSYNRSMFD